MNCRDVRGVANPFLREELLTETNREILRHLDRCPACRTEIDARRRLRGALRTAFGRAPELQPDWEFPDRLRDRLRQSAVHNVRSWRLSGRWFALVASVVLVAGVTATTLLNTSAASANALARDAIGDHRNCALKYRLIRMPVPLEEAAQRFDGVYRLLLNTPPDDFPTPDGPARVVERHSCVYGTRRFGHVILQYRGRVVSLLVTADDHATVPTGSAETSPRVIGRPQDGLSVVSLNGSRHAVMLVGDLQSSELTQLARLVALPLVQRLAEVTTDPAKMTAWLFVPPVLELPSHTVAGLRVSPLSEQHSPTP